MKIHLPDKVIHIIQILQNAGHEAYAVGGCVRDSILGGIPDDREINTSARPAEVKALFGRTIDTGIQHGTVTVMLGKEGFEVTTYRIDGIYEDGRHPREVTFTGELREDLRRRDFTVNAMAYNETDGLVDAFDGLGDLKRKTIRCVGDARERFAEDALRMMRAVRFSAQLGFSIEEDTQAAIRQMASNLCQVSAERIQTELMKLVTSPHPEYLRLAWENGITAQILPEFDRAMEMPQNHPHHVYSVGEHTLHGMMAVAPEKSLRLAMLFHDLGKPLCHSVDETGLDHFYGHGELSGEIAETVLSRLKFDNATKEQVTKLVLYHDYPMGETYKSVRRAASRIGPELFPLLFSIKEADLAAQSNYMREEKRRSLEQAKALYADIVNQQQCLTLKDLAVGGRDLIAAGMQPGKAMGETLDRLLELVLENPECNTKEYLLTQI